jgi:hypothetical protein
MGSEKTENKRKETPPLKTGEKLSGLDNSANSVSFNSNMSGTDQPP